MSTLSLDEVRQQRAMISANRIKKGGYYQFIKEAWSQIEQVQLEDEPHLKFIADHMEALVRGGLTADEILINIPPAHSKTILCVIMLTPWIWTWDPTARSGYVHNDINLARDSARKARTLIQSQWYQDRWPDVVLSDDASKIERFSNTIGGSRACFTWRMQITGWHAGSASGRGVIVIDDPNTPDDTDLECDQVHTFYRETLPTRFSNQLKKAICVVQQRLHQRDLSQAMLDQDEPIEHVCLPMEYDPGRKCQTSVGSDWRTKAGEILAPKRFPAEVVRKLKKAFSSPRVAEAQLNQNPAPEDGTLFLIRYFQRRYHVPTQDEIAEFRATRGNPNWPETWLPERLRIYFSWDCTYTAADSSDYAVGGVWGLAGPDFYMLDQYRAKMSFTSTVEVAKRQVARYPRYSGLLIEQAANGHALKDQLEAGGVKKVIPIKTGRRGKEERAHASTFTFQDGHVWFPEIEPPWFAGYVRELTQFPGGKHDDQVDQTTQIITWATAERPFDASAFMRNAGRAAQRLRV